MSLSKSRNLKFVSQLWRNTALNHNITFTHSTVTYSTIWVFRVCPVQLLSDVGSRFVLCLRPSPSRPLPEIKGSAQTVFLWVLSSGFYSLKCSNGDRVVGLILRQSLQHHHRRPFVSSRSASCLYHNLHIYLPTKYNRRPSAQAAVFESYFVLK